MTTQKINIFTKLHKILILLLVSLIAISYYFSEKYFVDLKINKEIEFKYFWIFSLVAYLSIIIYLIIKKKIRLRESSTLVFVLSAIFFPLLIAVFLAIFISPYMYALNANIGPQEQHVIQGRVTKKLDYRSNAGKSVSRRYAINLYDDAKMKEARIHLSRQKYNETSIGSPYKVVMQKGYLGITYIKEF